MAAPSETILAFQELIDRITAAQVAGNPLENVNLEIGLDDQELGHDDCPKIIVSLGGNGGREEPVGLQCGTVNLPINVKLCEVPQDGANKYYNATYDRGILWLLHSFLNGIGGEFANRTDRWFLPPVVSWDTVNETRGLVTMDLTFALRSANYQRGY